MVVNLWASLAYGLVLILAPDLFCDILQADAVNTACVTPAWRIHGGQYLDGPGIRFPGTYCDDRSCSHCYGGVIQFQY